MSQSQFIHQESKPVGPYTALTQQLHDEFRKANPSVGPFMDPMLGYDPRRDMWRAFITAGFTLADLQLVIRYVREHIKKCRWPVASMGFNNLIKNLDNFRGKREEAGQWSGEHAAKPPTQVDRVKSQWYGTKELKLPPAPKTSGETMSKLFADMRRAAEGEHGRGIL